MDLIKKRIAVLIPSLQGGGAEKVMVALANGFVERGLIVDLVIVKKGGPFLKDVNPQVNIIDLHSSRMIFSLPGLVKYLIKKQPEVLLSALSYANVIALFARKISRVKTRIVVSEHSTLSVSQSHEIRLRSKLVPWLMSKVYPSANAIIAVSTGVADDLASEINLPRNRVCVVHNPVVNNKLNSLSYERVDHTWFAPNQPPVIIAVGRFTSAKDFSSLIRAFSRVRKITVVRLVILGDGELRQDLEALVIKLNLAEDVYLPGFVDNPYAWMRKSALFVLSSAWEGLPTVLVEAMACGTPVVSTDCPSGPAEILEGGKWGRLVPVGNVEALAEAMLAALDDVQHPNVVARASDFGLNQAVDGYLRAFNI